MSSYSIMVYAGKSVTNNLPRRSGHASAPSVDRTTASGFLAAGRVRRGGR
jgi:hypothetical protein